MPCVEFWFVPDGKGHPGGIVPARKPELLVGQGLGQPSGPVYVGPEKAIWGHPVKVVIPAGGLLPWLKASWIL